VKGKYNNRKINILGELINVIYISRVATATSAALSHHCFGPILEDAPGGSSEEEV
jgi:hypothetical protein